MFVAPWQRLSAAAERAEYLRHRNDPDDPGYRRFLARLRDPLCRCLPAPAQGLDFGCGPGPALAAMLREAGYRVALYDPFFHPDPSVFQRRYQFITASEVVEHLFHPGRELARLWRCLMPGGVLAIMTKRVWTVAAFARWHYIRDPTHVVFFSEATFRWLARRWAAELWLPGADVALLRKIDG